MRQATTPKQIFTLPTSIDNVKSVLITYQQNGDIVIEKTLEDCEIEDSTISFYFTQEETNLFKVGKYAIQVRFLTNDNKAFTSEPIERKCEIAFNKVVLE